MTDEQKETNIVMGALDLTQPAKDLFNNLVDILESAYNDTITISILDEKEQMRSFDITLLKENRSGHSIN